MFDTICTYPLPSDLFAQALHPTTPLIAVGLASGDVQALRLPSSSTAGDSSEDGGGGGNNNHSNSNSSGGGGHIRRNGGLIRATSPGNGADGKGLVGTAWRTRRHKGSCRALAFSHDGGLLVSAGSEGLVKVAEAETGRVRWKVRVPGEEGSSDAESSPSLLHVLSPQTILLATDTSALHIYDFRAPADTAVSPRPQATHRPHDDYVSSLSPLPPTDASTSGFSKQWVSTGGSTLAVTDLRRGVMARSEDQEEELMSSVYVTGFAKRGSSQGEKVVVGSSSGVITLWEKGVWDDQDERIVVDAGKGGGEALDVLVEVPGGLKGSKAVAAGMGDGKIKLVALGKNKVIGELGHDDFEGVLGLGFEPEGRMVSGGGSIVKVWEESWGGGEAEESGAGKREADSESDGSDDDSEDESDEEEKKQKRRKKRKRSKGKDKTGGKVVVPSFKGLD